MDKGSLLICIAFHYAPERIKYLDKVLNELLTNYHGNIHIIIDTNTFDLEPLNSNGRIQVFVHENLEHPFHLTWMHRKHIKHSIDAFDNFMYVEDDMLIPYENYLNYLENFKLLWPNYVPSFVRIEQKDGENFISDIPEQQELNKVEIGGKSFNEFKFPYNYHAFWIMPQKELKETMKDDFVCWMGIR